MLLSLCAINDCIEDDIAEELGYFNTPQEAAIASYHLLSWMGKSGLPIGEQLVNYAPIHDKRLAIIETLVWEGYWAMIAKDVFIDYISLTPHPNAIQINYNPLWSF